MPDKLDQRILDELQKDERLDHVKVVISKVKHKID